MRTRIVTAALICRRGRILVAQRKAASSWPLYWEFPGGTLEEDEAPTACIAREVFEELGIDIEVGPIRHAIFAPYETFNILLLAYDCRVRHGTPRTLGCMDVRWADLKELTGLSMPPADQQIRQELLRRGLWGFDAA